MWLLAAFVLFLNLGQAHAQKIGPPQVTLGASATSVAVGATVTLTATATPYTGGSIVRVAFLQNGTQVAQSTVKPYTYAFAAAAPGTYTFTAAATDNLLATGTSAPVTITVSASNAPPTVSMSASPTTAAPGQAIALTAVASDSDGTVASVKYYANGTLVATASSAPYAASFIPSAAGTITMTAVATDDKGASTTSAGVLVTVSGSSKGNVPPVVSLAVSPASFVAGSTASLSATASDPDGTVTKVEFYNGTTLLSSDTSSPYTGTFAPTAAGTYSLTARAYDNGGGITGSVPVTVTVTALPQLPRVTLSLSNTLFAPGASVTLTGTAAATATGATVSRVSFYMNGNKLTDLATGPYSFVQTLPAAGTYQFHAEVQDSLGQIVQSLRQNVVVQTAPPVATTDPDIWRLLNQATFGASQAEAARVIQLGGIGNWINDQITKPVSGYPDARYNRIQLNSSADCTTQMPNGTAYPADSPQAVCARDQLTLAMVQRDFFTNALYAPDQLRQRVAWALSQILVISAATVPNLNFSHAMTRYQNILFNNAFGNYETLLKQVTYSPAMGDYLDMVNNDKPFGTRVPNENYAREIMQLFTINLVELNIDGQPIPDPNGKPIPTYDQNTIKEFARVFTGYTYFNPNNPASTGKNSPYYAANMVPYTVTNGGHDTAQKTLLIIPPATTPTILPAGQTAQQDIDAAVHNVFMHPNTPVYISKQLIQRLVTGNPSPAYVTRVATTFEDNGSGVRGDLAAVVKAILLDPEARGPAKTASDFGSLREPVLAVTGMLRALNSLTDGNRLAGATGNLGQQPYFSPTVFNYFMPDAKIPGTTVLGPEFGIHTTVTAVGRANLVYTLVYNGLAPDTTVPGATGTRLFLAPFEALADQPAAMVSLLNKHLAGGQFPVALEPTIVAAVAAVPISAAPTATERTNRARMAVYLMASSYDYQVQR